MARNVRMTGARNKYTSHCRFCGRTLYPGQGLIWKHAGRWYSRCAPGVGCKGGSLDLPAPEISPQVVLPVDVQKSDGSVGIGFLLSDGSLATLRK